MFARILRACALFVGSCLCFCVPAQAERWTWVTGLDFPPTEAFNQLGFSDQDLLQLGFGEGASLTSLSVQMVATGAPMLNPYGDWSYVRWGFGHVGPPELLVPKRPGQCGWSYEETLCFTGTAGADPTPGVSLYPHQKGIRTPLNGASWVTLPSKESVVFRVGLLNGWEPGVCFTAPSHGTYLFTGIAHPIDQGMKNPIEVSVYVNGVKTRAGKEPKLLTVYGKPVHFGTSPRLHRGETICLAVSATTDPSYGAVRAMVSVTRLGDEEILAP